MSTFMIFEGHWHCAVLTGRLEEARAVMALSDLAIWPIDRISDRALAMSAWQHYSNVGAYDAFYIATASGTAPRSSSAASEARRGRRGRRRYHIRP